MLLTLNYERNRKGQYGAGIVFCWHKEVSVLYLSFESLSVIPLRLRVVTIFISGKDDTLILPLAVNNL